MQKGGKLHFHAPSRALVHPRIRPHKVFYFPLTVSYYPGDNLKSELETKDPPCEYPPDIQIESIVKKHETSPKYPTIQDRDSAIKDGLT